MSITKDEATKELCDRGYNASNNQGVVTVTVYKEDVGSMENIEEELKKIFQEIDYRASYGIKLINKGTENAEDREQTVSPAP